MVSELAPTAQEARSQSSTNIVPYQSFGALLSTSHFIVTALFLTGATFGISYGITYSSVRNSPLQWVLFDSSEIINLCLTCFFMTLVMFVVVLHMARKRIVLGVQPPLAHAAYKSNWFKKIVLYPLGVNDWRRRIILILVQSFVFPTAFIIAGLAIGCHAMKERHKRENDDDGIWLPSIYSEICFITSLHAYLGIGSSYRAFLVLIIYVYNYLSAYNDAQPEIVEMRAAAVTTAISAAISENAAMYATNVDTGTSATHTNGSSGRHSYPNIPTGQVLYAIPMEMTTIPPPGTASAGNSHISQQGHSANRTGGDSFLSQQPPPYVTNQLAQYHGNAQHREEGDTASAYGYGYGGYGYGQGAGSEGGLRESAATAREQEPEGIVSGPQRRPSVEFYTSSHGVPSDRVPTQPRAPPFLFDMPLVSATDTATTCKVDNDNGVEGVLGGKHTSKSSSPHAEGEARIAPDVSPAAAFSPREPEDDEVGVAHAAGLGQDKAIHEISRNNNNGGVFANFEMLETDRATSASHSLNNRQGEVHEVNPSLGLNAAGPSPSPPIANPFE